MRLLTEQDVDRALREKNFCYPIYFSQDLARILNGYLCKEVAEDEREVFENSFLTAAPHLRGKADLFKRIPPLGGYKHAEVYTAWALWQARAALERKP